METSIAKFTLLFTVLLSPTASRKAIVPVSELQFESSDPKLTQAFGWAKDQALAYAHNSSDPVGPWYEAALPGRNAFCMRDVSHQTTGAAALGLYAANRNMLERFAASISKKRDWAGYWEIDRDGNPSSADYVSDDDFWYNLPANFDVLDSIVRMWLWTGDDTYLSSPLFQEYFRKTATSYLDTWDLLPGSILSRERIMNQHLAKGRYVHTRGIPSYTEGRDDFTLGADLIAAEYRAFESLQLTSASQHDSQLSDNYLAVANSLSALIDERAWSEHEQHFMGFFTKSESAHDSGDAMVLYFRASKDPAHVRKALSYIERSDYLEHLGIEEESYLAQTFYYYGEKEAAYGRILDITRPDKSRREYPEVSFSALTALVSGVMGVDVVYDLPSAQPLIRSQSRLYMSTDNGAIKGLHIRQNVIDLKHAGDRESIMTNRSGPILHWRPMFEGKLSEVTVNGRSVPIQTEIDPGGHLRTWANADVAPNTTVIVRGR
jgi:hypothetical protein